MEIWPSRDESEPDTFTDLFGCLKDNPSFKGGTSLEIQKKMRDEWPE
jgi:hypothetical protein